MATGNALCFCATPDFTSAAVAERIVGQAAVAFDVTCGKVLAVGQRAFASDIAFVEIDQPFFKFFVIVSPGDMDGTDSAIKPTWCCEFRIDRHNVSLQDCPVQASRVPEELDPTY
jgi:hypothetical protein